MEVVLKTVNLHSSSSAKLHRLRDPLSNFISKDLSILTSPLRLLHFSLRSPTRMAKCKVNGTQGLAETISSISHTTLKV